MCLCRVFFLSRPPRNEHPLQKPMLCLPCSSLSRDCAEMTIVWVEVCGPLALEWLCLGFCRSSCQLHRKCSGRHSAGDQAPQPDGLAECLLDKSEILPAVDGGNPHHLRNPGMMIPLYMPTSSGFPWIRHSKWCRISFTHSISGLPTSISPSNEQRMFRRTHQAPGASSRTRLSLIVLELSFVA